MGVSVLFQRKLSLQSQKHDLELKLLQISDELLDHQAYAAAISEGGVSASNLISLPNSVFGRGMNYVQTSGAYATMSANEKFALLQNSGALNSFMTSGMSPQEQQMRINQIYQTFHAQALDEFKKQETLLLNQKEKQISRSKTMAETQLEEIKAQLQSIDKALAEDVKDEVPKFGLS
ncbi:hypothetical protein IJI31_03920 [bacterium]|nr:hypothetical protein [bacterium]